MVLYNLQVEEIVLILSAQDSVHAGSQRSRETIVKILSCRRQSKLLYIRYLLFSV